MIQLRANHATKDPRLDRLQFFDERSKNFPIRTLVPQETVKPRTYSWRVNAKLDQRKEGACVGFSWAHEMAARPGEQRWVVPAHARFIYHEAQKNDAWPGGEYEGASPRGSGTSVLAGATVLRELGVFQEYRWAFGLNDLILGVGYKGPAVLGINWYDSMYDPDGSGFISPKGGSWVGGHAILCYGVDLRLDALRLWNSWDWNDCYLSFTDAERLLKEDGEACIPVQRKTHVAPWPIAA